MTRELSRKLYEKKTSLYLSPRFFHYFTLCLLGLLSWGVAWSAWGENWRWDGPWFRIAAVGVVAWASGLILQTTTTLPPSLAALITGIIARHLNILDMRQFSHVDNFLRKAYPCLILGKHSLGWNPSYMKKNWKQIAALGILPWSTEVLTMTVCAHLLLGFPWVWGIFLGSVYASLTVPVIMPSVMKIGPRPHVHWPLLVGSAGGIDLFLSVGVNGVLYSYIFGVESDTYRYNRAVTSLFIGVVFGFVWGWVCGHVPHPQNIFVKEMRVLMILFGGLFGSYFTNEVEWRGTAGVGVLICNATAAYYWMKDGWKLNDNPASTAYRVMWAAAEPLVFAYTGTYFLIDPTTDEILLNGFAILVICLTTRLCAVVIACWHMTLKEKIFTCCVWTPKAIIEAIFSPLTIVTLLETTGSESEKEYGEVVLRIIVEAILVTTPIGFTLTHYLGPWLLKNGAKTALESAPKYTPPRGTSPANRAQQKRTKRTKRKLNPRTKFRSKPKSRPKPKIKH